MNTYKVKNLADTQSIVDAAKNGATQFIIDSEQMNDALKKNGLDIHNPVIDDLIRKGNMLDWFDVANSSNLDDITKQQIMTFLTNLENKLKAVKISNYNLYKDIVKLIAENPNMTDKEIDSFTLIENDIIIS